MNKMSNSDANNKKLKRPKQNNLSTPKPEATKPKNADKSPLQPLCPLLAKDSEWVDILQTPPQPAHPSASGSANLINDIIECEDNPQLKPLAIMFPDLVEKDPQTLEGVLNNAMSTTEVTKHLVDLGQKANFTFMKKANRLIPPEKQWLEKVMEDKNSPCSIKSNSSFYNFIDYDADTEVADDEFKTILRRRRKKLSSDNHGEITKCDSDDTLAGVEHADASVLERPTQDQIDITLATSSGRTPKRQRTRRKRH